MRKVVYYFLLLMLITSCSKEETSGLSTFEVQVGDVKEELSLTGRVEASLQNSIMAPDDLTVLSLKVKNGQRVKKGDVLCELDPEKILEMKKQEEVKLFQLNAELKTTKMRLESMRKDVLKSASLFKSGAISLDEKEKNEQEYKIQITQFEARSKEVTQIERQIESYKKQAEFLNIKAPFDGIVVSTWVNPDDFISGSSVKKGDILFKVSSEGMMLVKMTVREDDINFFHQGDFINLTFLGAPGEVVRGRIKQVDNAATIDKDSGVSSFKIYVEFDPKNEIKPGMEATSVITLKEKKNVIVIPKTSINPYSSDPADVIIVEGNAKTKRQVKLGVVGDVNAEVLSGLQEGEKVLVPYEE